MNPLGIRAGNRTGGTEEGLFCDRSGGTKMLYSRRLSLRREKIVDPSLREGGVETQRFGIVIFIVPQR